MTSQPHTLAEFSILKGELERLLVKNRGLTSQVKSTAPQRTEPQGSGPQSSGAESTASSADSFLSYCSRRSSESAAQSDTGHSKSDTQLLDYDMHKQTQKQLADDVAKLLQHVDSAIGAAIPPADALSAARPATDKRVSNDQVQPDVHRLMMQQQHQTRHQQKQRQSKSRSLKSAYADYSRAQQSDGAAARQTVDRLDWAATAQQARLQQDASNMHQLDRHDFSAEVSYAESAVSISRQIIGQPDCAQPSNVEILRAACSVQSPDSLSSAAPQLDNKTAPAALIAAGSSAPLAPGQGSDVAANRALQALAAAQPAPVASPHTWHTNSLAQEGSQASLSGSSSDHQQATLSDASGQGSRHPAKHHVMPERAESPEHAENIAPTWQAAVAEESQQQGRWA